MRGDFGDKLDELASRVGSGHLVGTVEVNQVYAHYQEVGDTFSHPRGGHARFLEESITSKAAGYLRDIANRVVDEGPNSAMIDSMENLATEQLATASPLLYGNLRESGHPKVTSDGHVVYDREPIQRRLSDDELDAQRREHGRHRELHPKGYRLPGRRK